jgi:hypothetical protein
MPTHLEGSLIQTLTPYLRASCKLTTAFACILARSLNSTKNFNQSHKLHPNIVPGPKSAIMAAMPDPTGVQSLRDGEAWLKALTKHYIDQILFPPGLNATGNENVREAIKQVIEDTAFAHQNILGAVEQKCTWLATRSDGQRIFELVVNFSKSSLFDLKLLLC